MHRDKRGWRGGYDDDGELMAYVTNVESVCVVTSKELGGTYETSWPAVSDLCLGEYRERTAFSYGGWIHVPDDAALAAPPLFPASFSLLSLSAYDVRTLVKFLEVTISASSRAPQYSITYIALEPTKNGIPVAQFYFVQLDFLHRFYVGRVCDISPFRGGGDGIPRLDRWRIRKIEDALRGRAWWCRRLRWEDELHS